jgi:membrane-associated protease RseP (regulator of RpoE activity)
VESTKRPYLLPEPQPRLTDAESALSEPLEREAEESRRLRHLILLFVTAITTTLTGAAWGVKIDHQPESVMGVLFAPFVAAFNQTMTGNYEALTNGLVFTFTLLTILGAHELGHYFACRYYGIRATLPFFIPAPPLLTPFGTFGAVIKIKEPIRTRKALFDIGIAGPLAGFALALPASFIGLLIAQPAPLEEIGSAGGMQFHDPLLFILINKLFGLPEWILWNPVYWAAWGALLVTALNLFPVGQLDGGHVLYAVLGRRTHKWVSRLVCVAVATVAVVDYALHKPPPSVDAFYIPPYTIWTVVLLFLLKVGHPPVMEDEKLGAGRVILAVVAALVFLLCFMPFPITIS